MAMAYFEIKWAQSNLVLIQETTNWTMIWNQMALVQNIDPGNKKCLYNDLKLDGNGILWNLMGSTESSSEHWSRKQRTAWTSGRRPFVHICCCDLSHRLRKGWCQAYDLAPWPRRCTRREGHQLLLVHFPSGEHRSVAPSLQASSLWPRQRQVRTWDEGPNRVSDDGMLMKKCP